ncbi:uncharacterized protein LOC129750721 [Uranotaenia lowii]|uniref:uncharacterized protein LOC129750721 n=1 Tax=Uranotaenia lowii TaxID=190385 RepID=UPI00247A5250|nr:uncharacterized protein LOC129750721 [Uranotaenia lowii]
MLGTFFPAPFFQQLDFPKPSIAMSILAGLHQCIFATGTCIGFLLYVFDGSDRFLGWLRDSRLFRNAFFRVSGRISFSFYLIHMTVLELVIVNRHEAERLSGEWFISIFTSVLAITYAAAFLAFVFVEKPCDVLFKQLLTPQRSAINKVTVRSDEPGEGSTSQNLNPVE